LQIPLDAKIKTLPDTPHTIGYVIRKRQQLDSLSELPKDKQPPEVTIWDGTPEDIDDWLSKVFDNKKQTNAEIVIADVEGY
jgi:hypothetical protein